MNARFYDYQRKYWERDNMKIFISLWQKNKDNAKSKIFKEIVPSRMKAIHVKPKKFSRKTIEE